MTVRTPADVLKLTTTEERNGPGSVGALQGRATGKDQFPMPSDDTRIAGSPSIPTHSQRITVYLAGRFDRKDELAGYAAQLRDMGYAVSSRWLTGAHDVTSARALDDDDLWAFAMEDFEDIDNANILIAFTEDPSIGYTSGGRHVELGYALAQPLDVIVVGHRENIFHACLIRYDTWTEAREALARWAVAE